MVKLLENEWTNPFDPNESELVSISTGSLAPPDVARDLFDAKNIGEEAYEGFKRDRLEDPSSKNKFHDKMTKNRLKTFSTSGKRLQQATPIR